MSFENVKNYFESVGFEDRIKEFSESSATVELAAQAIGCEGKQIAKSMTYLVSEKPVMIVCAGNVKVNNSKYKKQFHEKSKMIPAAMVEDYVGHDIGGVCPFAVKGDVSIYLDESLKQNDIVYPAAGSENSAVKLSIQELEILVDTAGWVDVCKLM